MDIDSLKLKLAKLNQDHLVKYWNELTDEQKLHLYNQINEINFEQLFKDIDSSKQNEISLKAFLSTSETVPISFEHADLSLIQTNNDKINQLKEFETIGLKAIANSELGIVMFAGGMNLRLSVNYPKGTYSADLLSQKSLFQLFAERILRIKQLSNNSLSLPWYIMTSDYNHEQTVDFFEMNDYFGLSRSDVVFFKQDSLPCFDDHFKLILDEKYKLSTAPNGNGGAFKAIVENSILKDMRQRGVKYVHVCHVDNILCKLADPVFTGLCISNGFQCALKIVNKYNTKEPINPIYIDLNTNEKHILDLDLLRKYTNKCNEKESYGDAGYYFLTLPLLEQICNETSLLEYHKLKQQVYFLDNNSKKSKNSCHKLESYFINYLVKDFKTVLVDRSEEYSPLINMPSMSYCTKYHCKKDLKLVHYYWFIKSGAQFHYPGQPGIRITSISERHDQPRSDDLPTICEISPLVSYNGEGLDQYVKGKSFEPPIVLDFDFETNSVTFNGLDFKAYHKSYPTDIIKCPYPFLN